MAPPAAPDVPKRRLCWWWLLVLVLVSAAVGWARGWYLERTAADRLFRTGKEAFARGDLATVRTAAEALRTGKNSGPHARLLEGMLFLRNGRLFEAIQTFGHAKDDPETRALAYALSGEALCRARQFRDAEKILSTAIQLDPSQTDAHRWLAALYYDIGAMGHALEQLGIVAEQAPEDARPHRLRGLIRKDFEQYDKATAEYRESLRRNPNQPDRQEVLVELAESLVRQGRDGEALEVLHDATPSADVLSLQAQCRWNRGEKEAASKRVNEALQMAPNHLDALKLRAAVELDAGDAAAAVKTLNLAAKHHPKQYEVHYKLAQAYKRLGKSDLAQKEVKAMQESREIRTRFAKLHERAIADPTNADIRYELGQVALEFGKPELARSWFLATLAMVPDHAGARQALRNVPRSPPTGKIEMRSPR